VRSNRIHAFFRDGITIANVQIILALVNIIANRRWISSIARVALASGRVLDKRTESIYTADWTRLKAAQPVAEEVIFALAFVASDRIGTVRVAVAKMCSNFALVNVQTQACLVRSGKSVETGTVSSVAECFSGASARVAAVCINAISAWMASVIVIAFVDIQTITGSGSNQFEKRFSVDSISNRTSTSIRSFCVHANFNWKSIVTNIQEAVRTFIDINAFLSGGISLVSWIAETLSLEKCASRC
jgi:hypothetical protein